MCFLAISSTGGGSFWQFFCVSFPLGGCFLWLLLVVSLVMVVVAGRWRGGGKMGSGFFFFGTGFLGFSERSAFCCLIYFNV